MPINKSQLTRQAILFLLTCLISVSPCYSAQFGVAVSGNLGSGEETRESSITHDVISRKSYDIKRESIGFVADSYSGMDSAFSMHAELFYTRMQAKDGQNKYNLQGVTTVTDFNYGIIRQRNYRILLGPELVIEYLTGPRTRDGVDDYAYRPNFGIGAAVRADFDTGHGIVFVKGNYDLSGALMMSNWAWKEKYGGLTIGYLFPL